MSKVVNMEQVKRIKSGHIKRSDYDTFSDKEIMAIMMGKDYVTKKGTDGKTGYEYMQDILACSPKLKERLEKEIDEDKQ